MTFTYEFIYGSTFTLIGGIFLIVGYFVKRAISRWDRIPGEFAAVVDELRKAIKSVVDEINAYKEHNEKEVYKVKAGIEILKNAHKKNHNEQLPELPE